MAQATFSCLFEAIHLVRWGVCYPGRYKANEGWLPKNGGHPSQFKESNYKVELINPLELPHNPHEHSDRL